MRAEKARFKYAPSPRGVWSFLAGSAALLVDRAVHAKKEKRKDDKNDVKKDVSKPKVFFASDQDLKERVRESLERKRYCVSSLYKETGLCQKIARQSWFEMFALGAVAVNALWMGFEMDLGERAHLPPVGFLVGAVGHAFTALFSMEWLIKFCAFKKKRQGLRDGWFAFDTALVGLMVMETWVFPLIMTFAGAVGLPIGQQMVMFRLARLLRLTRTARMVRVFQAVPELLILVKGIYAASRSVVTTVSLLLILLYIFALTFRGITEGTVLQHLYFQSVPHAMQNLLLHGVFLDGLGEMVLELGKHSLMCVGLFWSFVLVSSLTVLNMLIAVVCDAVSSVAATEKEANKLSFVKGKMKLLRDELVFSGDEWITQTEFTLLLHKPEAAKLLQQVGVDVVSLVDEVSVLFEGETIVRGEPSMNIDVLMEKIMNLRGTVTATARDVVGLQRANQRHAEGTSVQLDRVLDKVEKLEALVLEQGSAKVDDTEQGRADATKRQLDEMVAKIDRLASIVLANQRPAQQNGHTVKGDAVSVHFIL